VAVRLIHLSSNRTTTCNANFSEKTKKIPIFDYVKTGKMQKHTSTIPKNTRLVFTDNGQGTAHVLQENAYYPFGLILKPQTTDNTNPANNYLYNNKELQTEMDLDWLDYGARFYDAQTSRFVTVDPEAEQFYHLTPYNYCGNDPINNIDPDGRIFGRARAWVSSVFNGGEVYQNKYGDWVNFTSESKHRNFGGSWFSGRNTPEGNVSVGNVTPIGWFGDGMETQSSVFGPDDKPETYTGPASGRVESVPFFFELFSLGGVKTLKAVTSQVSKKSITSKVTKKEIKNAFTIIKNPKSNINYIDNLGDAFGKSRAWKNTAFFKNNEYRKGMFVGRGTNPDLKPISGFDNVNYSLATKIAKGTAIGLGAARVAKTVYDNVNKDK